MEKPADSKEKREHPRAETNKTVTFRVDGESDTCLGLVFNASLGGLFLRAFRDIPVGARIVIEVGRRKAVDMAKGHLVAEIVRKDICLWDDWEGYEYGIKFIRASEKSNSQKERVEPNHAGLGERRPCR